MSNSRAINKRADTFFTACATKCSHANGQGFYHDRVVDFNNFEVVHAREEGLTGLAGRKRHFETLRSPQKGRTSWAVGNTWAPLDDHEVGLDLQGDWCDEEYEKEVTDEPRPKANKPKKKSCVSVSLTVLSSLQLLIQSSLKKRPHVVWKETH